MWIVKFAKGWLLVCCCFAAFHFAKAQTKKTDQQAEMQSIINGKNYVFVAETALPSIGRSIILSATFDLRVSGDSIISYLPFFGRAYTAPLPSTEGGIKFTSTNNSYTVKTKKDGWDISIKPKENIDVRQLFMSVSKDGYATLRIISTNRQTISFYGLVQAADKPR